MKKIEIIYCSLWNYKPEAVSLAADLKKRRVKYPIKLVAGEKGIFDVTMDGELIYSKASSEDFPSASETTEIANMINSWQTKNSQRNRGENPQPLCFVKPMLTSLNSAAFSSGLPSLRKWFAPVSTDAKYFGKFGPRRIGWIWICAWYAGWGVSHGDWWTSSI